MSEFEIVFEDNIYGLYSQVALFDASTKDSYPQWKTGDENIIFGQRGVVVATATDQPIAVSVCKGKGNLAHILCISGEIFLGDQGFIVGNIASENKINGTWHSGLYSVTVYTNGVGTNVTKVVFFVDFLK